MNTTAQMCKKLQSARNDAIEQTQKHKHSKKNAG